MIVPGVIAAQAPQASRVTPIDLPIGRSLPFTTPVNVTRVSITNPEIADLIVISEREIVINSLKPGETDAIIWLADSTRTHYRISVHSPADRKQIAISIKFAEVRRDALRELGVSGLWRDAHSRVGSGLFRTDDPIDAATGTVTIPSPAKFLTMLSDLGTDRVLAFLETEESRGKAKLLAEPTILAGNNETATFLAGGEIPIPTVQGQGVGSGGIGITYRQFGIQLTFTGEILSDSLIKLTVAPEVSSLDFANALQIAGFRIPAFATRRMSSTIDVRRDQSLIISGMFSGEESNVRAGVPFLKDLPVLGYLFSSSRFQRSESELLVVVTPMIVDPYRAGARALQLRPDSLTPAAEAIAPRRPPPPSR